MRTGSTRALLRAAVAGIALLPIAFAAQEPTLVAIAPPRPIPPRTPWIVVHRDLRKAPPVRLVSEWIHEAFTKLLGTKG